MKRFVPVLVFVFFTAFLNGQDYETERSMDRMRKHASYKKARRNPRLASRVFIKNYTDSVFPNSDVLQFENSVSLSIRAGEIKSAVGDSLTAPHLRIDTAALKTLTKLRYLSFEGFDFSIFPLELCYFRQLKGLALGLCKIKALPDEISNLTNLTYIEFRANSVNALPSSLFTMQKIEVIDIGNNNFTTVPNELIQLRSLRYLNMENLELSEPNTANKYLPFDIGVNRVNLIASYPTIRYLLLSGEFELLQIDSGICSDYQLFVDTIKKAHLTKKVRVRLKGCQ